MKGYLTTSKKDNLRPALLLRDGSNCLFCGDPLVTSPQSKELKTTFEHLDSNPKNNNPENLSLCHWKCNQQKKVYPEFQLIAKAKIENLSSTVDSLGVSGSTTHKPASKEIDLNVAYGQLTYEYLNDRLIVQGKPALNYNGTAESIAYIMWQRTGHGSPATVK